MPVVRCQKLRGTVALPEYKTVGAAGADLSADFASEMSVTIYPGAMVSIPTGLILEIPAGFEGQIRSRSGLAATDHIAVLNSPGTLDSDFRGEVRVLLYNHGARRFDVYHGDRIAQLVIAPVNQALFVESSEPLTETERGAGGFGSTGVSL